LYSALHLNSGIDTFITPETAFTFRDRIFGFNNRKDGMGDLIKVLGQWKEAIYVPPRPEQAFQQGGVFIFRRDTAVSARHKQPHNLTTTCY